MIVIYYGKKMKNRFERQKDRRLGSYEYATLFSTWPATGTPREHEMVEPGEVRMRCAQNVMMLGSFVFQRERISIAINRNVLSPLCIYVQTFRLELPATKPLSIAKNEIFSIISPENVLVGRGRLPRLYGPLTS
jgi:hypothetical protein